MQKEQIHTENKIELHHPEIEDIMGSPPASLITVGSGVIFILIVGLFIGSFFFTFPDVIDTTATIQGDQPLEVLVAPESGKINFRGLSEKMTKSNDTVFEIYNNALNCYEPVRASLNGILEIDPLINIKKNVQKNDTIGFIWDTQTSDFVCYINLSPDQIKKVKVGNKVYIHMPPSISDQEEIVETYIQSINIFNTREKALAVVFLPEQLQKERIRGSLYMPVEIIVREQTFFERLINPFRGLIS